MLGTGLQDDELGQTVAGRYVLERLLGHGGTARVYAARDVRLNRSIALKRSLLGTQLRQRTASLEREFHTLAQLAHPTIIEVYDFGVDANGPYYTMELLDGHDLHQQGRLPWREVCALLRDVASSLALLHARSLIHRDVSARNVRRTVSGHAKLIDFGAMTAFGVTRDVLGTPPFFAPEALQLQALDGRADLYALGALGYYLLTGVHAYPARKFRELRDAWRTRPAATSRYQPDIPVALNDLILQLLSLDCAARPQAAAEVMQRLCAIADLPVAEHALVSRAYLTTPALQGRDAALFTIRRHMLALARGRGVGATLLLEGEPGSGRSRLLDACAFEAKLVGACVLRACASHDRASWSVARTLVRQLVQLQPEAAEAAARFSRDVLAQVLEEAPAPTTADSPPSVARGALLRELRNFFLALTRVQRLVILVDDVERIDEASAALLAALAHKTQRHPLVLGLTVARDSAEQTSASLRFLRLVTDPIAVDALVAAQTEALLRSVFGDAPGLPLAAGRIHALSRGNPTEILEFAQHLVDQGLAIYQGGTWSLPGTLSERSLPASLSARSAARLAALSADALELCEALCIADADSEIVSVAQFAQLTSHGDTRRVFRALDELVLAHILVADPERHRFSQRTFVAVVDGMIEPVRRRQLHAQLADILSECAGDTLRRADHLLSCDREHEALDLIDLADLYEQGGVLPLLGRALAAASENNLPALRIHAFRSALVRRAAMDLAVHDYRQHAPRLLAELERASGLARYRELDGVPEPERLKRALGETVELYTTTPEAERLLPLSEAIRSTAMLCAVTRVMALATFDRALLEDFLPTLTPFETLSPVIGIIEETARINQLSLRGRFQLARDGYEHVLSELIEREQTGQILPEYTRARYAVHYVLGMLDAGRGRLTAEAHAVELARERTYRVNAWRIRALLNLAHGDLKEAADCRRRAELAVLREGMGQQFPETTAFSELQCYALCGDLKGVHQTTHNIAQLAARFAGWQQFFVLGQCHELRLLGDAVAALTLLEPMLLEVQPGVHAGFACLAACHLQLLCDASRTAEAAQHAAVYLAACEREQLSPAGLVTHVAAADAFAKNLEFEKALDILERALTLGHELGHGGVCIGHIYEARARLALALGDTPNFEHYATLCASAYGHARNPHLAAKLARLAGSRPALSESLLPNATLPNQGSAAARDEYATLHSRMLECVDEAERARCALTMLLQELTSLSGCLYGVNEGGDCALLAKFPEGDADPTLAAWVVQLVATEIQARSDAAGTVSTDTGGDTSTSSVSLRYSDAAGRSFEPLFLIRRGEDQERMAAVLIFEASRSGYRRPSRELQEDLADQLLSHSDVRGVPLPVDDASARTR